jgi:signal transduction histidine kinase
MEEEFKQDYEEDFAQYRKKYFKAVFFTSLVALGGVLLKSSVEGHTILALIYAFALLLNIVMAKVYLFSGRCSQFMHPFAGILTLTFFVSFFVRGGFIQNSIAWYALFALLYSLLFSDLKKVFLWVGIMVLGILTIEFGFHQGWYVRASQSADVFNSIRVTSTIISVIVTILIVTIHNRQLHLYLEKITEYGEMKQILFSVLYHDLSSPIMALELGLDTDLLDDKNRIALKEKVKEVSQIIHNVRSLEKMRMNKIPEELEVLNIKDEVQSILCTFKESLKVKNIAIEMIGDKELNVMAQSTGLRFSVLGNLISNAIKFSHLDSKIIIYIEALPDKENTKGDVLIHIQDFGQGIPSEQLSKVFNMRTSRPGQGTQFEEGNGFGLPIAKKYAKFFGGDLRITSSVDGTIGTIQLKKAN